MGYCRIASALITGSERKSLLGFEDAVKIGSKIGTGSAFYFTPPLLCGAGRERRSRDSLAFYSCVGSNRQARQWSVWA